MSGLFLLFLKLQLNSTKCTLLMISQGLLYRWTAHSGGKKGTMSAEGGPTWDQNYTQGVDFLDQALYNEGSNFILVH